VEQCLENTFLSSQFTCETCFNSCKSCEGPKDSDCISCKTGLLFADGLCLERCPDNTTNNNSFCVNDTCLGNCGLCGLNKSFCITCKPGYFYDNATKSCLNDSKCSSNYYFSNGECKKCDLNCFTCEEKASNCTNCVNYYNKDKLIITNITGICDDKCPNHFYGERQVISTEHQPFITIVDYFCKECDENCLTCETNDLCSSCNTTKFLEYGNCVTNCRNNLIILNTSCMENCTNSNCFKCSTENTNQCTECSSIYPYLLNLKCYSEHEICNNNTHQYITSKNPNNSYNCVDCDEKCQTCTNSSNNCRSCYSNNTNEFPFLYNFQCVAVCPAGFSADYGDNLICKDFICGSPCEKCSVNQSTCYECDKKTPFFFGNYCYSACPMGTIYKENSNICVVSSNGNDNSEIWASWIVLANFLIVAGYFIFSLFFLKNTVAIGSSLICLLQIIEFLSKLFIFGFLFKFQELTACIFSFIGLVNNLVISMIFQTLYIGVLEIHIRSFSLFKSSNKIFYYFVLIGMLIFGINFTFAFSSGLLKFIRSEFETNFAYAKGLNRMVLFGLALALMQVCVDCYILYEFNVEYDVFHLAYINLIMNIGIYSVWGGKNIKGVLKKAKKLLKNN